MKIEFEYLHEDDECCLENPELKGWGCCCQCAHHLQVNKHCCHSPVTGTCVCSESLDFYVCVVFHDIEDCPTTSLSGKHGVCECFVQRKSIPTKIGGELDREDANRV